MQSVTILQNSEFSSAYLRRLLQRQRAHARGMTLVEILIVLAIIATIAGGAAAYALPKFKESQIKAAVMSCRTVRGAVHTWQAANNESTCPTVAQLIQDKQLDSANAATDPWGQEFILICTDDEVFVGSVGPDKKKGTKDDIQVPAAAKTGATP